MFFYAQRDETDLVWLPYTGKLNGIFPEIEKVVRVCIIGSDEDPTVNPDTKQFGYFMMDIDSSDLSEAIQSGNTTVQTLLNLGVREEDFQIELSGSKGVHIYVKPDVFGLKESIPFLGNIYGSFAKNFYVPGLDFQIYNGQRGRLVRQTNSQRPDGAYKVKVTVSELSELTEDGYKELVKAPRNLVNISGTGKVVPKLTSWFKKAVTEVTKEQKTKAQASDEEPVSHGKVASEAPECIKSLLQGDVISGVSFNSAHYPVAVYARFKPLSDADRSAAFKLLAKNMPSTGGADLVERVVKAEDTYNRVLRQQILNPWTPFCQSMRQKLKVHPACTSCKFFEAELEAEEEDFSKVNAESITRASLEMDTGLKKGGKGIVDRNSRRLTNFHLAVLITYYEESDVADPAIISYRIRVTVPASGLVKDITIPTEAWVSKKAFVVALAQVEGARYDGNEGELTRLRDFCLGDSFLTGYPVKNAVFTRKSGMRVYNVYAGKAKHSVLAWVEPEFSVDENGLVNTYYMEASRKLRPLPSLQDDIDIGKLTDCFEAFKYLWLSNAPEVSGPIIAFMLYTHLSQHLSHTNDGSLVSMFITAESGTGKTALLSKALTLYGYSPEAASGLTASGSLGGGSSVASIRALAGGSTAPMIMNEVNRKSMAEHSYRDVLEMLKSTFDRATMTKCKMNGAGVDAVSLECPFIVASEEPLDRMSVGVAVTDRLLKVKMQKRESHARTDKWTVLCGYPDVCSELGRALAFSSLNTKLYHIETLLREVQERMPRGSSDRQLSVYSKIMTSVVWAKTVFETLHAPDYCMQILDAILQVIECMWTKEEVESSIPSTVTDSVIDVISCLDFDKPIGQLAPMKKGVDYAISENGTVVAMDVSKVYPYYAAYMKQQGKVEPYKCSPILTTTLRDSEFASPPVMDSKMKVKGRQMVYISLVKLREATNDVPDFN